MKLGTRPSFNKGGGVYRGGNSRGVNRISGSIPTTHPGTPTIGTATAGDGTATANWAAPSGPSATTPTSYEVRRHNAAGAVQDTTTVAAPATTSGPIASANGTAVKFTVRAINAKGNGQYSAFSNTVTPAAP